MAKAKKLPSGNYRVRVFGGKDESGKPIYKSFTSEDKDTAECEAAQFKAGRHKINSNENLAFTAAEDRYISSKQNLLSPSTVRGYRTMQHNCFSLLDDKKLGDIAESNLVQQQINENGKKYSAKSLRNQCGFISTVMKFHNFDIGNITLKPKQPKTILVPTKKDSAKIMMILSEAPNIECQVLLALTCSLRQSEIAAIRAEDVHGAQIYIHAAKVPDEKNKLVYKPTNKSSAGTRTIDMPPYLTKKIADKCKEVGKGYLFDMTPVQVLYYFKRLLKKNGLPPYTMHSLRHCFAATLHAMNVPDKYIMEMGGWSSDYVMKQVYQYTFDDETSKIKKSANTYFENILEPQKRPHMTRNMTRSKKA